MDERQRNAYTAALPTLLRLIQRFAPDLIHASQFCFGHLPIPIPTVVTAHSDALSWAAACQPEGFRPSPWLTQYTVLVRQGLASASAVVAPTRSMLDELRRHLPFTAPGHVVPNGRTPPPAPPNPDASRPCPSAASGTAPRTSPSSPSSTPPSPS